MGYYGGLGPMVNGVLWMEVGVFAFFVGVRLYTRHRILNAVGVDDYLCITALVIHILYTIFVSIATHYGLGKRAAEVGDMDIYFEGVKWVIMSQFSGILVIGIGKAAVGMFLLRIIRNKIQIAFIYVCLVINAIITLFASITAIVQCSPIERTWNRTIPGTCWIEFSNIGYTVGSWFVAMDFAFAILPWFVVWGLNMKHKEKITVACGLSLGLFAGVCGIIRTEALSGLNASEYLYETIPMLIWSATESCATIMCSSIPVLRPLYTRIKYGKSGKGSSGGENSSYQLPMYGGSSRRYGRFSSKEGLKTTDLDLGTLNDASYHQNTVITHEQSNGSNEDTSILRSAAGIERTDEVMVTYEQFARKG
ncbi:hypothetical protein BJY04DRAFT_19030 [Aspergillus karnatakaensis]|uniref:uncharacterized protein n=1 Tax=Aspergillus karnatakaensis TaxID=1810916 RepID=UPI003CCD04D9